MTQIILYSLIGIILLVAGIKLLYKKNSKNESQDKPINLPPVEEYIKALKEPVEIKETLPSSSDSFLGTIETPKKEKAPKKDSTVKKTVKKKPVKKKPSKPAKEKTISKEGDKGNDLLLS